MGTLGAVSGITAGQEAEGQEFGDTRHPCRHEGYKEATGIPRQVLSPFWRPG